MSREAELEKCIEEMKKSIKVLGDINNHLFNENTELKRKLDGLEKVIIALVEIDESIKAPYPYKVVVDCELQNNCMTVQGWNHSLTATPCIIKEQEHE